jgi:hypothetical protein
VILGAADSRLVMSGCLHYELQSVPWTWGKSVLAL